MTAPTEPVTKALLGPDGSGGLLWKVLRSQVSVEKPHKLQCAGVVLMRPHRSTRLSRCSRQGQRMTPHFCTIGCACSCARLSLN